MVENQTSENWLVGALQEVKTWVAPYYEYQTEKEKAKLQNAIDSNTISTTQQTQAQTTLLNNMTRNVILVVGATLGLVLAFGILKKSLK